MNHTQSVIVSSSIAALSLGGLVGALIAIFMIDPDSDIKLCGASDGLPPVVFETTLTGNIDFRNIQAKTIVMPADVGNPNGDPSNPSDPPVVVNPMTRLDLNLDLGNTGTKKKLARVIYKIEDSTIKFITKDNLGVTSVDKNAGMFCLRSVSDKSVVFDVKLFNGSGPKPNYGSFNLNVIVPDSVEPQRFTTPLSIDPEVKNHG